MTSDGPAVTSDVTASGEFDRAANLLGALALAVGDRVDEEIAAATDRNETAAAALCALHFFLDRPSIDALRQVLGVTSSGAVRTVDRLVGLGLVTRRAGEDARSTSVVLTAKGRRAATAIAAARGRVLARVLEPLTPEDRATFERLVGQVLAGMIRPPGSVRWTCRLCDTGVCGRDEHECPVANAAAEKYA